MESVERVAKQMAIIEIADLGIDFDQDKINPSIEAIQGVLNRPISGLNIVTTNQGDNVQFYGWQSPIATHADNTGYIFFMPLSMQNEDTLIAGEQKVRLKRGVIYALNDAVPHSTVGKGNVIAAFVGSATSEQMKDVTYVLDVVRRIKEKCFKS